MSMNYENPGQAEGRHEQQMWREQSAGLGRATENQFANETRVQELREKVARLEGDLQARNASIEKLVAQMQEGERRAQGNEKLMALNDQLQAEAQAQKVQLLQEIESIIREKKAAEEELADF